MRVHHLAFRTRDVERLVGFYSGILGLPVTRRSERGAWLDAEGTLVMLERCAPGEPEVPPGSMEIVVFGIAPEARAGLAATLAARGVPLEAESEFTLYFRDPDGRRVGLSHYPTPQATTGAPGTGR